MSNWILDNPGSFILAILAVCALLTVAVVNGENKERAAYRKVFMAECLQDRKQYECDVLFAQTRRQSNNANNMATGLAIGLAAGSAGRR